MQEKCIECGNLATVANFTQFCGTHFYCKPCAEKQSDYNEENSYHFWGILENESNSD